MTDLAIIGAMVYIGLGVFWAFMSLMVWATSRGLDPKAERASARAFLQAPIWPFAAGAWFISALAEMRQQVEQDDTPAAPFSAKRKDTP